MQIVESRTNEGGSAVDVQGRDAEMYRGEFNVMNEEFLILMMVLTDSSMQLSNLG